jgi:uncharacterized protein Smg (DUF494 family)
MYFLEKIETKQPILPDDKQIAFDLKELGFSIEKLQDALAELQVSPSISIPDYPLQPHTGIRVFHASEMARLTKSAQDLIMLLERTQILTSETREQIIDHALNLEAHPIFPGHIKWIALMVLSKQSDKTPAAYMERLLAYEEGNKWLH